MGKVVLATNLSVLFVLQDLLFCWNKAPENYKGKKMLVYNKINFWDL